MSADPRRLARRLFAGRGTDIAVAGEDMVLSHRQLRHRVRELRAALRSAGVGPGDVVAVYGSRSPLHVVAVLATFGVQARVLLLDPAQPALRLADCLRICAPAHLLLLGDAAPGLVVAGAVLRTDESGTRVVRRGSCGASGTAGYLLFTSGSTGVPECVVGSLPPVVHFLDWYSHEHGLCRDDRFALLAGLGHDPLLRDLLLPLWCGGTVHVPTADTHAAPRALFRWLADRRVTVVNLTPPLARSLVRVADRYGRQLPELRLICLSGAVCTGQDVTALSRITCGARIVVGYGTTETPQLVSHRVAEVGSPPTLGAGAPGSELLVVDRAGRKCPVGEPGWLVVRGRYLADRYLDETLTATRFAADPVDGVRRFHTGDRGRHLPGGDIEFLGRADGAVDIRGHRAHPAEVDRVLADCPWLTESVTVADRSSLVSYVVPRTTTAPEAIREFLAARLPDYLVPALIVPLARLPLTPNGKIDRAALVT